MSVLTVDRAVLVIVCVIEALNLWVLSEETELSALWIITVGEPIAIVIDTVKALRGSISLKADVLTETVFTVQDTVLIVIDPIKTLVF